MHQLLFHVTDVCWFVSGADASRPGCYLGGSFLHFVFLHLVLGNINYDDSYFSIFKRLFLDISVQNSFRLVGGC